MGQAAAPVTPRISSYDELAQVLGLTQCRGILPTGHYCHEEHRFEGSAKGGFVHFADRPFTQRNTLDFLRLAITAMDPPLADDLPWRRVYRRHIQLRRLASRFGVHYVPSGIDRAFVLAGVAGLSNEVPMRKQAFDWARRGPKLKISGDTNG